MTQTLISRASWGARHDDGFGFRPLPIKEWWLHHSVTIAPDLLPPFDDDDRAVRTLETIGEQRFGGGISYTFPVTPVGRIYVGHSLSRLGAHTKGHNTVGAAFVLVGDYSKVAPTEAQRTAIARRMVIEHRAGRATRHTLNGGHRDASGNATACPGNAGHAAVAAINAEAEALWAAGYPTPPTPPAVVEPGAVAGLIAEDGKNGPATRRAIQRMLGVTADGSWGPATRRAIQKWAGVKQDGSIGPATRRAVQRKVGAPVTGTWNYAQSSKADPTTRRLQAFYNRAVRARGRAF